LQRGSGRLRDGVRSVETASDAVSGNGDHGGIRAACRIGGHRRFRLFELETYVEGHREEAW